MSVKIAALEAENVKRIKAVALTPSPTGLTIVGGNNNQGKTSVLDALAWALGGEKFRPTAAVRDGALAPPHLKVILSNGVVVERKGRNSSLTVTDPTGQRSGQQLLNAFVEPLTEITHAKHRAMDELTRLDEQLKNLQERRSQLMEEYNAACVQEEAATKTVAQLQDESTAELEQSIRNVEEINRQVSANLAKSKAQDEAERYAQEYTALTEQIKAKRTARMDLLNGADLPLTGLGVEDGSLTYNGKHWQDMSGSDQLRVATAIVRRLNPDCGFVLLDKLEQMDLATLAEFGSWLQAEGLQAIATRVSTGGECQIIIEDGRVKDAEEPPAPKAWTKGAF